MGAFRGEGHAMRPAGATVGLLVPFSLFWPPLSKVNAVDFLAACPAHRRRGTASHRNQGMNSLWNEGEAAPLLDSPLALRVYTSRLLGRDPSLVLHGGGNTSVKAPATDLFGDEHDVLYVKGSGWDLATIEEPGFAPVRMDVLTRMAGLETLSDSDMVSTQRAAMLDPDAPNPSVEAVLHAIIPFAWVDHTHADAVVALTNSPNGRAVVDDVWGERALVIPYVMPGFDLAKAVHEASADVDWSKLDCMILMNHGIFTFGDTAKQSYERMISAVTEAEACLERHGVVISGAALDGDEGGPVDLRRLAGLRRRSASARGRPMIARLDTSASARAFAERSDVDEVATRGPLTPDHVIRTKRIPLVAGDEWEGAIDSYAEEYRAYFDRNATGELSQLDPAPRWVVWPGVGTVALGDSDRAAGIVEDIVRHTVRAIGWAEAMGGWVALPESDVFDVEYWELEQAKLRRAGAPQRFAGQIALVTGAASGIGRAVAERLSAEGAAVVATDVDPSVATSFTGSAKLGLVADATDRPAVERSVHEAVRRFGGLDIVVCNAGVFPPSASLDALDDELWQDSLDVNLTGHLHVLRAAAPFLRLGCDPAVVLVASKNVLAPGPGAAAYSVAKAGMTQLGRVAALELGKDGVRVNTVHPHAVFDTGAWSDEVVAARAAHYGMSPEEYRTNNVLGEELTSKDVAAVVAALAGPDFSKITGAQLPLDGGSDRII